MDNLDEVFRRSLQDNPPAQKAAPLTDEEVRLFIEGRLDAGKLERVLERLAQSPDDRELVAAVRRRLEGSAEAEREAVAESRVRAALQAPAGRGSSRCPHCGGPITPFKTPPGRQRARLWLWAALCAAGFAASFLFPRYFLQCLAASLLAGIRWALDARALKSQVLIYRALSEPMPMPRRGDLQRDDTRL